MVGNRKTTMGINGYPPIISQPIRLSIERMEKDALVTHTTREVRG